MLALLVPLSFEQPLWLLACLTIPLLVVVSMRSLAGLEPARRGLALATRSLVIASLAAALARAAYLKENRNLAVMFVVDRSRSIPDELQSNHLRYMKTACKGIRSGDKAGLVMFDAQAYIEQLPSTGGIHFDQLGQTPAPDRTDLAQAIRMAMATLPEDMARRIVLVSDGCENVGDVLAEARQAAANRIAIDVVPMQYSHTDEILVDRMVVPSRARKGDQVPIRLVLRSRRPASGKIALYHNNRPVALSEEDAGVELGGGMKPVPWEATVRLGAGGVHRFRAEFEPDRPEMDGVPQNNVASAFTVVEDKGTVLLLTSNKADDLLLLEALQAENTDVRMELIDNVDLDLLGLQQYSTVILANMPADAFTDEQQRALASFVKDLGGGLIMIGGDDSFGAGGWIGSPVEEVMPVFFEIKHRKMIPRGALVLIMHTCEMPRGNYWAEQVAIKSVNTISSADYFGVLAYSWSPGGENWEIPLQLARNKPSIIRRLRKLKIGDMPDFDTTMDMAVQALRRKTDAAQKHVIVISDGDAQPPSAGTLRRMKAANITCSTVAIGYGVHVMEGPLRRVAKATEGKFYACRNPNKLPQIFVKEAKVVRRKLIDETPFRPRLGYALSEATAGLVGREIPPLGGLVITTRKPLAEVPLDRPTTDGADPVLAHWQCELGRTVAFTSGWWPHWGTEWTAWPAFSKLWAQVVRWSMRPTAETKFDVMTRLEGTKGHVVVEALDKDASYLNFLRIAGAVLTPRLERQKLGLVQTGPGHYEGSFDATENGQYLISLAYFGPNKKSGLIRTGLVLPYSPEYRQLATNEPLLRRIVDDTGGRWLDVEPDQARLFSRTGLQPSVSRRPVWEWIIKWLILPLFLLDVAGRRLASALSLSIFVELLLLVFLLGAFGLYRAEYWWTWPAVLVFVECVGWAIRFRHFRPAIEALTNSVASLARAGERSAASLARLRATRDKVRDELAEGAPTSPLGDAKHETPLGAPEPDRGARFDVGDEKAAEMPVADLHEAVGGAKTVPPEERRATPKPGAPGAEAPTDEVTARLLKAKKRARKEMDQRSKQE